jgi:hypothetical protein
MAAEVSTSSQSFERCIDGANGPLGTGQVFECLPDCKTVCVILETPHDEQQQLLCSGKYVHATRTY